MKNELLPAFPNDGCIPLHIVKKIEQCIGVFRILYPEYNEDVIRELFCILYRRGMIEMR